MKLKVVAGKNNKLFIAILDIVTKHDMELFDVIKTILSRSQYFPFMQGFNKTISYSYLFNDIFFPAQFWQDIKTQLDKISEFPIVLENEDLMYNNEISRDDFDEFISTLKVPEDIKIDSEDYKFQQDCAYLSIEAKIARIEVGTSGGKTFITYLYCKYLHEKIIDKDKKILIVVPSKLLCNQLQSDFKDYDKFNNNKLLVETIFSGAAKYLDSDVVCGTYQSLRDYEKEYFDDFQVVICDEVHGAKAYSIKNEIYTKTLNGEYFFGMSGTYPKYNTLDYLHIISMFGPVIYKKTASSLIEDGISTPIRITTIKINYEEHSEYSTGLIEEGIVGIEKFKLEKEFFHNYEARTKLIGKLLNNIKGNALILVSTVEYCSILKDFLSEFCPTIRFEIIHGKVNNRSDIIADMKISTNFCLIGTYGTMATGVSIKNIEQIHYPDGGKSEIRIRQGIGRGMRIFPAKEFCHVFDYQDMIPRCCFKNHAAERNRIYREQNFPIKISHITI